MDGRNDWDACKFGSRPGRNRNRCPNRRYGLPVLHGDDRWWVGNVGGDLVDDIGDIVGFGGDEDVIERLIHLVRFDQCLAQ